MGLVIKVSREQLSNIPRKGYLPYRDLKEEKKYVKSSRDFIIFLSTPRVYL
jgi:hypothetical protein